MPKSWAHLGAVSTDELAAARTAVHWAIQPIAAVGYAAPPESEDHSRAGFTFEGGRFVGRCLGGLTIFVDPVADSVGVCDASGSTVAAHAITGSRPQELSAFIAGALDGAGLRLAAGFSKLPYELPSHELGEHAAFEALDADAVRELCAWFDVATDVLAPIVSGDPRASPVRGWPHHFDLASLIELGAVEPGRGARSIGVGLSPGDVTYAEPYFYVTPWPYPEKDVALPDLDHGAVWHRGGFTAAVLTADVVTAVPTRLRRELVQAGLRSSIAACEKILAG